MTHTFFPHLPVALLAGSSDIHAAYLNFFQNLGYHVISFDRIADTAFPSMHALYSLSYELLILPGGGDFSPALYRALPSTNDNSPALDSAYVTPYEANLDSMPVTPHEATLDSAHVTPYEAALDMLQFSLLTDALHKHVPIVGICKGMQLINVYFGGTLYEDMPGSIHSAFGGDCFHKLSTLSPISPAHLSDNPSAFSSAHLTDNPSAFSSAHLSDNPLCDLSDDSISKINAIIRQLSSLKQVNSAHHQGIHKLAPDFICLQRSPDGICETILHTALPIIGFQWHPERMPEPDPILMKNLISALL